MACFNPFRIVSRLFHALFETGFSLQQWFNEAFSRIQKPETPRILDGTHKESDDNTERKEEEESNGLREFEDSLKQTGEENEKEKAFKARMEELKRQAQEVMDRMKTMENDYESSHGGSCEAQRIAAEEEFQRELAQQNEEFRLKMEELRKQREEIEREASEELRRIREESQMRIRMFLRCCQMKIRFEETENEWGQLLDGLRKPLVNVVNSYDDVQSELRSISETMDDFDRENVQHAGKLFGKKVASAQEQLSKAFEQLKPLTEKFDDRVFIKIILKSLSDLGYQCNSIGQQLVEVMENPTSVDLVRQLDHEVSKLSPHAIPTTTRLKRDSVRANTEDYVDIPVPPDPIWADDFYL